MADHFMHQLRLVAAAVYGQYTRTTSLQVQVAITNLVEAIAEDLWAGDTEEHQEMRLKFTGWCLSTPEIHT